MATASPNGMDWVAFERQCTPDVSRQSNVVGGLIQFSGECDLRCIYACIEMQREAKELLELSQSLQPDMESVNHGILPKDTIEKLKRIEKLSKRLRGELGK